jgi:hypothetical protein
MTNYSLGPDTESVCGCLTQGCVRRSEAALITGKVHGMRNQSKPSGVSTHYFRHVRSLLLRPQIPVAGTLPAVCGQLMRAEAPTAVGEWRT